jgi:hypothetical protein
VSSLVRLRTKARRWLRGEKGLGELAAAIFIIPIIISLVFGLIELGWFLRYRSMVDEATRITTMMVAQEGANELQPWSALADVPGAATWSDFGREQLRMLCFNSLPDQTKSGSGPTGTVPSGLGSRCRQFPAMACTPATLQENPGEKVSCTATFYYQPLTNPFLSLGVTSIFTRPIVVTIESQTSIGKGRP